jgi:hypothetical protein
MKEVMFENDRQALTNFIFKRTSKIIDTLRLPSMGKTPALIRENPVSHISYNLAQNVTKNILFSLVVVDVP